MSGEVRQPAEKGWFADWDREAVGPYVWQPCFGTGQGHIPCFEVWFSTKAECEAWIAEHVIGVGWLDGEPSTPPDSPPAEKDALRERIEALIGGPTPPVFLSDRPNKIVRVQRRDDRLGATITESMVRVNDIVAALRATDGSTPPEQPHGEETP